jgi:hypothetical protein
MRLGWETESPPEGGTPGAFRCQASSVWSPVPNAFAEVDPPYNNEQSTKIQAVSAGHLEVRCRIEALTFFQEYNG